MDFDYLRHIFQASIQETAAAVVAPEPVKDVLKSKVNLGEHTSVGEPLTGVLVAEGAAVGAA